VISVNIPDLQTAEDQEYVVTRLGHRSRSDRSCVEQDDPRGHKVYWIGGVGVPEVAGPGTDFHAIENNKVSITPITTDMTAHVRLNSLGDWLQGIQS